MDIMSFYVQLTFVYYEQNVQVNQPYIKPKLIGQTIGKTSRTTLTKYMNELVENKILRQKKIRVEVYYLNDDLLRILEG